MERAVADRADHGPVWLRVLDAERQPEADAQAAIARLEEAPGARPFVQPHDVEPVRDRLVDEDRVVGQHLVQLVRDPAGLERGAAARGPRRLAPRRALALVPLAPLRELRRARAGRHDLPHAIHEPLERRPDLACGDEVGAKAPERQPRMQRVLAQDEHAGPVVRRRRRRMPRRHRLDEEDHVRLRQGVGHVLGHDAAVQRVRAREVDVVRLPGIEHRRAE